MRNLIYYVASTLDGFIAHQDGSLDGFPWDEDYGERLFRSFPETFPAHLHPSGHEKIDPQRFDVVLMGRKTYEVALREGIKNPYPHLKQYIFSRSLRESPHEDVILIPEKAIAQVRSLKQRQGKSIWLCGGASLASALMSAGLIDRLIIKLNPVVFGSGIPLLSASIPPTPLELVQSEVFPSGHALLEYVVQQLA